MSRIASSRPLAAAAGFGITSTMAATAAWGQIAGAGAAPGPANKYGDQIETVNVTANRTSLDKLTANILNTPQSINLVPLEVLEEQGTANLEQALKNVPGITLNAGEGGAHGDTVNLRGFSASDDFFLDGLRDTGFYTRDSFNYQAVEVYKGPASTLFGRGSTGGVVNQVSKTPELYQEIEGSETLGSNDEFREAADINEPFGDGNAIRINAVDEHSHVAGRPYANNHRLGFAPTVAFGIDTPTALTLAYYHEEEDNVPDPGIPFLFGKPAPVPHDAYYGLPSDDRFESNVNIVTATLAHEFSPDTSFTDKARYGFYLFASPMTAPHYGTANCYTGSAPWAGGQVCNGGAGNIPVTATNPLLPVAGMPLADIFVTRDRPSAAGSVRIAMNESDVTWKFTTGPFSHTLVTGIEVDNEEAAITRYANQSTQIVATPLLDPNPNESFPGHQTAISQQPDTVTDTIGAYFVDTIAFSPQWSIMAALRQDRFAARYNEPVKAQSFHHTNWVLTPRAALIYKPNDAQSYYISYGTSYDPSAENLSLSSRTADLNPEKDRTFEAGGKQQILDGKFSLTEAVFDTEMTNARIADPLNPTVQALAGNLTVRGAEFDAAGKITPRWEFLAGYTYLDAKSVGLFGTNVTGPIPNTGHNQANLWSTYEFDGGWKIGLGANYLGRRAAFEDSSGVAYVPGYVTFDGLASYQVNDHLTLRLNGYNLFDKWYYANVYYSSAAENHAVPGAGRTVTLTASVDF